MAAAEQQHGTAQISSTPNSNGSSTMVGEMESSLERVRQQLSSTSSRHILRGPLLSDQMRGRLPRPRRHASVQSVQLAQGEVRICSGAATETSSSSHGAPTIGVLRLYSCDEFIRWCQVEIQHGGFRDWQVEIQHCNFSCGHFLQIGWPAYWRRGAAEGGALLDARIC